MSTCFYVLPIILSLVFLISCSTDSTPVYNLSVTVNPPESGTVSPSQGGFDEGSVTSITADPSEGWNFVQWQGDYNGTENPASVTINSDTDILAVFEKKEYPLTVETVGEGDVNQEILQQKTTDYEFGTVVELTALPAEGWVFTEWKDDLSGNTNPEEIEVESATEVTALFDRDFFSLNVEESGDGIVQSELLSGNESESGYEYGSSIELSAIPDEGWSFTGWSGDLTGSDNPATYEIGTENNVTANFAIQDYSLSLNVSGEGAITEELLEGSKTENGYSFGSVLELTANPSEGWEFKGWSGDADSDEQTIEVVVDENISVTAEFEEITYLEVGETYEASDGLLVTLDSFEIVEKSGSFEYNITYTLENNTDIEIDEGTFKLFAENTENNQQQFGFFGSLFPDDTLTRSYTFEEVKDVTFTFLAYHDEIFFANSPPEGSLIWRVEYN